MGELVAGTPALRLTTAVSLPLDLVSVLSLLHRAAPGSGLDPWLIAARRGLPAELREDLDLLHGFSGPRLYYVEEPVMRFRPLAPEHAGAGIDDLVAFLEGQPPAAYRAMAADALARVRHDLGLPVATPGTVDEAWRQALQPALTTADADEVLPLLADPTLLKERTIRLFRGVWEALYRDEYAARLPGLQAAARRARDVTGRGFGLAFADLTGNRPPAPLVARLAEVERVAFCPSPHLGSFVSYILYPPELVVFFGAPELLARLEHRPADAEPSTPPMSTPNGAAAPPASLSDGALLDGLRALADPTRLQVLELIGSGELYAQEIVGRLGIAQSAVSRHLAMLERAGFVTVRPRGGMKYYALDRGRLDAVAETLRAKGAAPVAAAP
jgi:ArsR family transcriptional regulator